MYLENSNLGFEAGKGARDAIGMLIIVLERTLHTDEELCACFIDWQVAFDRVNWTDLVQILKETGINWHERRLIGKLYTEQSVQIQLNQREKKIAKIGRGFRQGCCLSPIIFTSYGGYFINQALEWFGSFKIQRQVIRTGTYAHDLVLLAKEETVLQGMIGHILHRNRLLKQVIGVGGGGEGRIQREDKEEDISSYLWPYRNEMILVIESEIGRAHV
jgi:hypothetical protein